jgi:hypothetical protein
VEANLNAKAEIIESSVVAPSPPPKTANMDDVVSVITEFAKIANVQSLPPAEGCGLVTGFS